ncbi:hypothetical protein PVAND_009764 [Polypedilum vanderplanki]|uniref:GH18 domain-containing protein n=1 Tax=Polypedilum vanderplanki TaxID=319348 RepID=A0A9J6CDI1_POLVA|nr:hypothetical protein PVAND_009764 [Polypedilum vanderplanki]
MGKKNMIYVASWAVYRNGSAKFSPEDIEATYGTHFIYSFLGADSSGNVIHSDKWGDIDQGNISKFIALKSHNPSAKFMFSMGNSI